MRPSSYAVIDDKNAANSIYPSSIAIINAPNRIPTLGISLAPNKDTGKLTVGDLINRVIERYASLGLTKEFPADKITIMIANISYDISNKTTLVYDSDKIPNVRIYFPPKIEPKYLANNSSATESTPLTNKESKSLWNSWFGK